MTILKTARFAALMAGGSLLLAATPSLAQGTRPTQRQPQAPAQAAAQTPQMQLLQQRFNALTRGERPAFTTLITAAVAATQAKATGQTPNWAAVQSALPAAQAVAKSNEAKFFIAQIQLELALGSNNVAGQEAALAALLANPILTPAEQTANRGAQAILLNKRAEVAFNASDFAGAERIYRQLLQNSPNDPRLLNNLRIVQERQGNTAGALQGIEQQIQAAEASGQRAPEALYQRGWQTPYRAGRRAEALSAIQRLIKAYPTAANWRTAFEVVREPVGQDTQLLLDTYRFARAANVVKADEYEALARSLDQAGLPGETKAVIDAGVAAGALRSSNSAIAGLLGVTNRRIGEDRTGLPGQIQQARSAAGGRQARIAADVLYGYGRYGEAAELYRLALSKGGEDANLLNTRLGATLALAGQRAEAETALRAVTGARAELAALWLAWLNRRQG